MRTTKRQATSVATKTIQLPQTLGPNELGKKLKTTPVYLNSDHTSWYILARNWYPSPSDETFQSEWTMHPKQRHNLKLFGKVVQEKRWSQAWGMSYSYSGATNLARPLSENDLVGKLVDQCNDIVQVSLSGERPYNTVLQNWYTPDDTIGLHADDERINRRDLPIFSLSWGGTRRFLFRTKKNKVDKHEIYLHDGDLVVMGGTCQMTHHHEVPKFRKTMDPPTDQRINWTIRAFEQSQETYPTKRQRTAATRVDP